MQIVCAGKKSDYDDVIEEGRGGTEGEHAYEGVEVED